MQLQRIKSKIESAIADEANHGRLASLVRQVNRSRGTNLSEGDVQQVVEFVKEYIRHVPYYMEKGMAAARRLGMTRSMDMMMSELETYWLAEEDLIPDHLGLVGLMDDAYASLLLLQSTSEYCSTTAGSALLGDDLSRANQSIRALIGEPYASEIDRRVGLTLAQNLMQDAMNRVAQDISQYGGPVLGVDRSWGGYTVDEYVDVQLGAMGVV